MFHVFPPHKIVMNSMASHENANPKSPAIIFSLPKDIFYIILSMLPIKDLLRLRSVCKPLSSLISNPDFVRAPDTIMYNIFLWLPVKDLSRLMSVCKSWLSLISSRDFANAHLSKSTNDPHFTHHHLILNMGDYDNWDEPDFDCYGNFKSLSVYDLLNETVTEDIDLDTPMNDSYVIVGYCHGLICLISELMSNFKQGRELIIYEHVYLWNPSTGKSRILPKFDALLTWRSHTVRGFCYDESNDDFKVFTIFGYEEFKVAVYSLKSDSWRIIGDFSFGHEFYDSYGKFANGAIHWGVGHGDELKTIVSVDIKTEMFREVGLPNYIGETAPRMTLGTFDESLSMLYKFETYADLWVMKECGTDETWTKLFTIPYMNGTLGSYRNYLATTSISVNGNIILNFGRELSMELYDPKEKKFQNLFHDNDRFEYEYLYEVDIYVESLVSPYR